MVTERPVDRRTLLKLSGLSAGAMLLSGGAVIVGTIGRRPHGTLAQGEKVVLAYPDYPDVAVAKLADLQEGDVVFFSAFCAHMGAPLDNVYDHDHGIFGPCPLHFSTFDLTKSGMLIMGK